MATITKSIRITASCQRRIGSSGGDCVSKVTGDTDRCSYTTTTSGVGTPTNCSFGNAAYTPCLVGMSGEPCFKTVSWVYGFTEGGVNYTRVSTSGGSNSSFASATYESTSGGGGGGSKLTAPRLGSQSTGIGYVDRTIYNDNSVGVTLYNYTTRMGTISAHTGKSFKFNGSSGTTNTAKIHFEASGYTDSDDVTFTYVPASPTPTTYTLNLTVSGVGGTRDKSCNLGDIPYKFTGSIQVTYVEFTCQSDCLTNLMYWSTSHGSIKSVQSLGGTVQNYGYRINFNNAITLTYSNTITISYEEPEPVTVYYDYKTSSSSSTIKTHEQEVLKHDTLTRSEISSEAEKFCPDGYTVSSFSPTTINNILSDSRITVIVVGNDVKLTINYYDRDNSKSVGTYSDTYDYGQSVTNILSIARNHCPTGYSVSSVSKDSIPSLTSPTTITAYVSPKLYDVLFKWNYNNKEIKSMNIAFQYGSTCDPVAYGKQYCPANYQYESASRSSFVVTGSASVTITVTIPAVVTGSAKVEWRRGQSSIGGNISGSFRITNYTGTVYLGFSSSHNSKDESYSVKSGISNTISGSVTQGMSGTSGWAGGGFSTSGGIIYVFNTDGISIGSFKYTAEATDAATLKSGSAVITYVESTNSVSGDINGSIVVGGYSGTLYLTFDPIGQTGLEQITVVKDTTA